MTCLFSSNTSLIVLSPKIALLRNGQTKSKALIVKPSMMTSVSTMPTHKSQYWHFYQ
ncbi:hypothetical protein KEN51_CDS0234 [Pseudomonas phage vB_Pae10145-KEN51]|nr:hypothetical protein [Pseudomonas phage ANB1]WNV50181.1 hypothetical protein [Pseudomonas phage PhiPizzaParty]WRQ05677.1 hypothetical protein IPCDMZAV_CDS0154 [Pseudomonas phage 6B]WRQ06174.1 hypothetical protein QAMIJHJT_CDS0243 [Pseudomonas phage 9-Ps-8B]WRQ06582.1 hypothetical protein FOPPYZMZ_CDS0242 [Pseudomonas phage 9Ps-7B]WRQ06933.1 hypothetical protein ZBUARNPM_CDS0184 [Pseudomonas phage 14Ps5-6]